METESYRPRYQEHQEQEIHEILKELIKIQGEKKLLMHKKKTLLILSYAAMGVVIMGFIGLSAQDAKAQVPGNSVYDPLIDRALQLGGFGAVSLWSYIKITDKIKEQVEKLDSRIENLETRFEPLIKWWERSVQEAMKNRSYKP